MIGRVDVRYATEGSRAVLAETFTELGVRVVWAETMTVNHASRKVMELGMTVADTAPTPPDIATVEGSDQGGVR